jgi:hypothetical protein
MTGNDLFSAGTEQRLAHFEDCRSEIDHLFFGRLIGWTHARHPWSAGKFFVAHR